MNRFTHQVLPILMGVAAVLLSIASIVVIVVQIHGPQRQTEAAAPAVFSSAAPSLQALGRGLTDGLGGTYLGVSVQAQNDGLLVHNVIPGSPAARAGVQANDVITAVNGTKVTTVAALRKQLDAVGAGKQYTLTVTRNGASHDLHVQQSTVGAAARDWFRGAFGNGTGTGARDDGGFPGFGGFRHGAATPTPDGPHA